MFLSILKRASVALAFFVMFSNAFAQGWSRGYINHYLSSCHSDLCTAQIDWRTSGWRNSVVTVEIPGESEVKLFSCAGVTGHAEAPWIAPGKYYVFKLYESDQCSRDVGYYQQPLDELTVATPDPHQPGNPGNPWNPGGDRPGYGTISAYRSFCRSDLCTYQINWNAAYNSNTVVTVEIPGSPEGEKLMSCEGTTGHAEAPWIAHGKTYIFRLYTSSVCSRDVRYQQSPSAQVVVQER